MVQFLIAVAACWCVGGVFAALMIAACKPTRSPLAADAVLQAYQTSPAALAKVLDLEERERRVALREAQVREEDAEQSRARAVQVAAEADLDRREADLRTLQLLVLNEMAALEEARREWTVPVTEEDFATPMLPAGEPVWSGSVVFPAWLGDDRLAEEFGGDDVPVVGEPVEEPGGPAPTQDEPDRDGVEWTPDPVAYADLVAAQQPDGGGSCSCTVDTSCSYCVDLLGRQVEVFASLGEPEPDAPIEETTPWSDDDMLMPDFVPGQPLPEHQGGPADLVMAERTSAVAVELADEARVRTTHKLNKRPEAGARR